MPIYWFVKKPVRALNNIRWRLLTRKSDRRFIFILCCPRIGGTLLQLLIGAHSQGFTAPGVVAFHFFGQDLFKKSRFTKYVSEDTLENIYSKSRNIVDFVENFYDSTIESPETSFIVEKIPAHFHLHRYCKWIFPNSTFVALVRDGRDACCSALAHKGTISSTGLTLTEFAYAWKKWTNRILDAAPHEDCIFVRYEELVTNPRTVLQDIMRHSGVEFEEHQLDPQTRRADPRSRQDEFVKLGRDIDSGSVGQFRSKMSESDIAQFHAIAGDCLKRAGYDLN